MSSILLILVLHPLLSAALLNHKAYYIQTDEGPNRFFQFSSGPGGQFRKETILPNGTVVGVYSWKDGWGKTRLYSYTADKRGYRVTQHRIATIDNSVDKKLGDKKISEIDSNDLFGDRDRDKDVRRQRNSKNLRLRRKVLVKRQKSGAPKKDVRIKKLGAAAEIIPYQPTLLLSNQYPGRKDQMRLVGDDGIVTINTAHGQNNEIAQTDKTETPKTEKSTLPTSVLLQRIKVQPSPVTVVSNNPRPRKLGRMVKRRRRKKTIESPDAVTNDGQDQRVDTSSHESHERPDNVYFAPL